MVTAALVTGNTVIMKPAEPSAILGALLMEIFEEAGVPPGVLNCLHGRGSVIGAYLVDLPVVELLRLPGWGEVGWGFWGWAGKPGLGRRELRRAACELGDRNAAVVVSH